MTAVEVNNVLLSAVAQAYIQQNRRLLRLERFAERFVEAACGLSEPGVRAGLFRIFCEKLAEIFPTAVNAMGCRFVFTAKSDCAGHSYAPGEVPVPMGYVGGSDVLQPITLTEPATNELPLGAVGHRKTTATCRDKGHICNRADILEKTERIMKDAYDAASRRNRPGDGGNKLHMAADVAGPERTAAGPAGEKDTGDVSGKAVNSGVAVPDARANHCGPGARVSFDGKPRSASAKPRKR